jgi:hypothetical protein
VARALADEEEVVRVIGKEGGVVGVKGMGE